MEKQKFENNNIELFDPSSILSKLSTFDNNRNNSQPIYTISKELSEFIDDIIRTIKKNENSTRPDLIAEILSSVAELFPFYFPLRIYVEHFCGKFPQAATETLKSLYQRKSKLKSSNYRISLAEILAEIENQHLDLIQSAKYCGMEIWPILRSFLATEVENNILAQGRLTTRISDDVEKTLQQYENAFTNEVRYSPPDISFLKNDPEFIQGKLKVEFLFFSRALRYLKRKNGFWVDGPCDYLHQLLAPQYSCLKIEEFDDKALMRQPRVLPPKYFQTPWDHNRKKFFEHMKSEVQPWSVADERCSWKLYTRSSSKLGLPSNKKRFSELKNNIEYASGYAHFFKDLIRSINPSFVFQEFYYSPESIGLILACKSLGIPVIEVQHGLIGTHQWQSTHWVQTPELSHISHPDYFWVFDEFEKQNSEIHLQRQAINRPAIVAGHAELELYRRNYEKEKSNLKHSHKIFLNELGKGTYNILFSPQYHHVDFTGIVAVSRALPKDARLLVRLHPMQLPLLDGLVELIEKYGTDNIEVEYSTKVPLYDLMETCHHVITKYSTLAREALEFDMDVTLLDDMGRQLFQQYFNLGRMSFCDSNECLVDHILAGYESFVDQNAWKLKCSQFRAFRQEHLIATPEKAIDDLREDWKTKVRYRADVAKFCADVPLISKTLNLEKCAENKYIKNVDRSSGNFKTRRVFLIDEELPVNRNNLAKIYHAAVVDTSENTALDIVFYGSEAAKKAVEILTLFYGMSHRPVNVHIDPDGRAVTESQTKNTLLLQSHDLQTRAFPFNNQKGGSSKVLISASNDVHTQTQRWLASKGLTDNFTVLTFSDDVPQSEVEAVLSSNMLHLLSDKRNVIVNGSWHFETSELLVPEGVQLFEPGVYAFDAAVALGNISECNIIISNDGWEQLFYGNKTKCVTVKPEEWHKSAPADILLCTNCDCVN